MGINPSFLDHRLNGTIKIQSIPPEVAALEQGVWDVERTQLYTWSPPYQLAVELPSWYDLSLVRGVTKNGVGVFMPVDKAVADAFPDAQVLSL